MERNQGTKDTKQSEGKIIKNIRNLFKPKKEIEAIKDRIIRDIKILFEQQEEYFQKSLRVGDFYNKTYIEYESNDDINKTLSIKVYLDEIKPYLKDILDDLKKSATWKIHLIIGTNFTSSKDIDEGCVIHSKSDNTEIMIYDKPDEVIEELFE